MVNTCILDADLTLVPTVCVGYAVEFCVSVDERVSLLHAITPTPLIRVEAMFAVLEVLMTTSSVDPPLELCFDPSLPYASADSLL